MTDRAPDEHADAVFDSMMATALTDDDETLRRLARAVATGLPVNDPPPARRRPAFVPAASDLLAGPTDHDGDTWGLGYTEQPCPDDECPAGDHDVPMIVVQVNGEAAWLYVRDLPAVVGFLTRAYARAAAQQ